MVLLVEIGFLLVFQVLIVVPSLLETLCEGTPEDVAGQHSLPEASVSREWVSQLDIVFPFVLDDVLLIPLVSLSLHSLSEFFSLDQLELVLLAGGLRDVCRLRLQRSTSWTTIFVLGTPTMSAAVRCSISDGCMLVAVCVEM